MSLKKKLQSDLKEAMRHKDETRKRTIRLALATITNTEEEIVAPAKETIEQLGATGIGQMGQVMKSLVKVTGSSR